MRFEDIDLQRTQRAVTEDLWLQIVNQRQNKVISQQNPNESLKLREAVATEFEIIMENFGFRKKTGHEIKVYSQKAYENILRVAQAFARDNQKSMVDLTELKKAFRLFKMNANTLAEKTEVKPFISDGYVPPELNNEAVKAVRVELSVQALDVIQLFENVKEYFRDLTELQTLIDKLKRAGYIFALRPGCYQWI